MALLSLFVGVESPQEAKVKKPSGILPSLDIELLVHWVIIKYQNLRVNIPDIFTTNAADQRAPIFVLAVQQNSIHQQNLSLVGSGV